MKVVQNQFCVVPFGLNISNAAFGKGLEAALNNYSIPCTSPNDIHTYVDDILLSSHSFESHLNTLEWIFHKIARVDPGKTIPSTPSLATPLVVMTNPLKRLPFSYIILCHHQFRPTLSLSFKISHSNNNKTQKQ